MLLPKKKLKFFSQSVYVGNGYTQFQIKTCVLKKKRMTNHMALTNCREFHFINGLKCEKKMSYKNHACSRKFQTEPILFLSHDWIMSILISLCLIISDIFGKNHKSKRQTINVLASCLRYEKPQTFHLFPTSFLFYGLDVGLSALYVEKTINSFF